MNGGFGLAQQLEGADGALLSRVSVSGAERMISRIADKER